MITGHGDTSHPQSQGDLRNLRLRKKVWMKNFQEEDNRRIAAEDTPEGMTAIQEGRLTPH
jgi:hypothetical protein